VLYAARGLSHDGEEYWTAHRGGHNHIHEDGRSQWRAEPDRNQQYLLPAMPRAKIERVIEALMLQEPKLGR
jgi:hypothetical protein